MAVHVPPAGPAEAARDRIIELVGKRAEPAPAAGAVEDSAPLVSAQLLALDNFVEIVRLRTELAERDLRIATLTAGLRSWRETAMASEARRRSDAIEAHEREREVVSLLHQQMQVADAATAELEGMRSRRWWRRRR